MSSPQILNEYLVRLGFDPDRVGYQRFVSALRDVESQVGNRYWGMIKKVGEFEAATLGAFAAIGVGALGFMDRVAMSDQSYRLFALHMYTSLPVARELKVALDALGQPLENVMWDPELAERFHQLVKDQQILAEQLGPNFERNMLAIRDARFEVTRFGVELKYLGMNVVNDLFKAFGKGGDDLEANLKHLNDWFIANIPFFAYWITTNLKPALLEIRDVFKTIWDELKQVNWNTVAADINKLIEVLAKASEAMTHLVAAFIDLTQGDYKKAYSELQVYSAGVTKVPTPAIPLTGAGPALATPERIKQAIVAGAQKMGIPPDLALAVADVESGFRQFDKNGNVLKSPDPRSHATGIFQLQPKTAAMLGVDPNDVSGNIQGGLEYLRQKYIQSGGNWEEALERYYGGSSAAARRTYAGKVLDRAHSETHYNFQITVNASNANATADDIARAVSKQIRDVLHPNVDMQIQRNINEFSVPGWAQP